VTLLSQMSETEERRGGYRILVGNPETKISPGRPRRRWKGDIKMDLKGIGQKVVDGID